MNKVKTSAEDVLLARRHFLGAAAAAAALGAGLVPRGAFAQEGAWSLRPGSEVDRINFVVWQFGNIYDEIAAQFEADWGVPVEKIIEPNIDPQIAKLTSMYAAGEDIDVLVSPLQTMASYIDQGIAAPLDGLPGLEDYAADMTPLARSIATRDDQIWGLPYLSIAWNFIYNSELLEKAGFADKPFTSWEELTEQCLKAKADGVSNYPLLWVAGAAFDPLPGTWFAQVANRGGRVFAPDMTPELGPGSVAREALQYFQDSFLKHEIADPDSLNLKFLPAVKVFNTGNHIYLGALHNYYMNLVNDPAQSPIAGKGRIHPLPGDGKTLAVTWYYMLSEATRDREWAWKLLQYLGGKTKDGAYTQALKLAKDSMLAPGYSSVMNSPELREVWSQRVDVDAMLGIFDKAVPYTDVVPAVNEPWYPQWNEMLNVELTACLRGQITADEACDNMVANIDRAKS
ncbi:extracellular solute-binding protein [Paracoccus albus]|uniref:extracellular solute-binding protein n=1 Tax=Paracoccus albus TaxID=3017784 RepID=UPI0022F0C215|nr:extracellular solute-binding protein [Paracoccus albus]WBU60895.1 extracellular solute-binding protein [Paracoccus albus]